MSSARPKARRSRPVGRPAGVTSERTRGEILDAALEAFAEGGFEAMSVRELTRRLGVSHNLVHHHFGSKDDLWRAALDHGVGATLKDLDALLRASVGSPNAREVLRTGLGQAVELTRRRPEIVRIFAEEATRPGPRLDYLYDRYLGPMIETLRAFLAESGAGPAGAVDSRIAALFLASSATALVTYGALAEKLGLARDAQTIEILTDLALGGLMPKGR